MNTDWSYSYRGIDYIHVGKGLLIAFQQHKYYPLVIVVGMIVVVVIVYAVVSGSDSYTVSNC